MLPSERIRSLSKTVVIAGVRKSDPACEALRKEFDARATGWVIVLDARGELLDSWAADKTGALKKKESAEGFPALFADKLDESLRRKETLQELERRWEKAPKEEAPFDALASRLEEMGSFGRLRGFCEKVAALTGLPAERRAGALLWGYSARPREFAALVTPELVARFVEEGEGLLVDHAANPRAVKAAEALFLGGYSGKFDVPAKSAAGIARLEKASQGLKEPGPLRERIGELSRLREKEIGDLQKARAAAQGNEASEAWYAMALGDAEATIRAYSQPPYDKNSTYQAWVREAREKLQRQK